MNPRHYFHIYQILIIMHSSSELLEAEDKETVPVARNEKPLGGKGNYFLPPEETPDSYEIFGKNARYQEDAPEETGEEETGPLESRVESKIWKTRAKAFEDLAHELKSNPCLFDTFASSLTRFISDSHPGAQERALEVLQIYINSAPNLILSHSENLVKALVEKCISSTKASIKNMGSALILDFLAEHRENFDGFIEGLVQMLNNKNLKVQGSAISTVNALISSFGVKVLSYKPFLPHMEKLAGNSNPIVRGEAINFYKECYKWIRELILPSVGKLKKPQQDELQKAFEDIGEEYPTPTRYLKHESAKIKQEIDRPKQKPIDIYDMADEKDIFAKYNDKWVDSVLEMDKWTEKKAALEMLNADANYPKLAEKNPLALVGLAKRLINDANVNVMIQVIKMIGLLAKGQRRYFEIHAKQFFPIFLGKLKDKKTLVIQEVFAGLENLLFSLSLEQVSEDIRESLEDKTPTLKLNVTLWLYKVYTSFPIDQLNRSVKIIGIMIKKNTDDSIAEIRTESIKLMGALYQKFPDVISGIIKDMPVAKIKKIEGISDDKPESPVLNEDEEEEQPKSPVKEEAKVKEKDKEKETKAKVEKSGFAAKAEKFQEKIEKVDKPKPPLKKELLITKKNEVGKGPEEEVGNLLTVEEAENTIISAISGEVLEKLKETSWKDKQEGLTDLSNWVDANEDRVPEIIEPLFVVIKSTVKDWKENNVNVIKSALELIKSLSTKAQISKKSAYVILTSSALDKLSDTKIVEIYTACLISLSEAVGPKFIVSQIVKNTSECNKPKVLSECHIVISKIIADFGLHKITLKEVVEYAKIGLNQANPVIKKSAQTLAVKIYSYLGDAILPLLSDVKEATLKALQEDFAKTPLDTSAAFKQIPGEEEDKFDPKKALDEMCPRVNVSNQVAQNALKKLASTDWKVRKEGLDNVEEILEKSGKRILATGLDELFKSLKARLDDSNKSIIRSTLVLLSKLAECLGSEAVVFCKVIVPAMLSNLADKQSLLRQDALATLDKWSAEIGAENVINYVPSALNQDNPELRTELLNWLLAHKESLSKSDLKPMAPGIISCLQDRTVNIRNAAELLFGEVVEIIGFDCFSPFLKDIKPAVMSSLKQIFDKYKPVAPATLALVPAPFPNLEDLSSSQKLKTNTLLKKLAKAQDPEIRTPRSRGQTLDIRIIDVGDKERRLDNDSRYKWSVEEIRPDYLEKLKEQLKQAFSPDLYAMMFNTDFKKQADATAYLTTLVKSQGENIIPYLDLLFKWTWIELIVTNNTQIYKAALEFDQLLVSTLESIGYVLNETEAGLLLPVLCEKSGQNNQVFRTMIRSIIHATCKIFSPEKVFGIVLQGINSKNAKSKVECLEELGSLIVDYGIELLQTKDVKFIAKQVSSMDNNVRIAAVDAMTEVYKLIGDRTWNVLGDIQDKVRGILDQRFRTVKVKNPELAKGHDSFRALSDPPREDKKIEFKPAGKIEYSKASLLHSTVGRLTVNFDKPPVFNEEEEMFAKKIEEIKETFNRASIANPHQDFREDEEFKHHRKHDKSEEISSARENPFIREISPIREGTQGDHKPRSIQEIRNAFKEKKMQKLRESAQTLDKPQDEAEKPHFSEIYLITKKLDSPDISNQLDGLEKLSENVLENPDSFTHDLRIHSKGLCHGIVAISNSLTTSEVEGNFIIYFYKVVLKLCNCDYFIKSLDEVDLAQLSERLLLSITIDKHEAQSDNPEESVSKTINTAIVKVIELAQPTEVFLAFISLLTQYKTQQIAKMSQILIRCILKLTKMLSSSYEEINLEKLIVAMNDFMIANDNFTDEMATKAMKTIVNELVKLIGEDMWNIIDNSREQLGEESDIEKWVHIILGTPGHTTTGSAPQPLSSSRTPNVTITPPISSSKAEPYEEIFSRIRSNDNHIECVKELADFIEQNPGVDLTEEFNKLNPDLADKVKIELNEIKKKKNNECQATYNLSDMQSRLAQMKQKYGAESQALNPAPSETRASSIPKPETSNIPQPKSRIQKFSKK